MGNTLLLEERCKETVEKPAEKTESSVLLNTPINRTLSSEINYESQAAENQRNQISSFRPYSDTFVLYCGRTLIRMVQGGKDDLDETLRFYENVRKGSLDAEKITSHLTNHPEINIDFIEQMSHADSLDYQQNISIAVFLINRTRSENINNVVDQYKQEMKQANNVEKEIPLKYIDHEASIDCGRSLLTLVRNSFENIRPSVGLFKSIRNYDPQVNFGYLVEAFNGAMDKVEIGLVRALSKTESPETKKKIDEVVERFIETPQYNQYFRLKLQRVLEDARAEIQRLSKSPVFK
jgi:hypothetical protein